MRLAEMEAIQRGGQLGPVTGYTYAERGTASKDRVNYASFGLVAAGCIVYFLASFDDVNSFNQQLGYAILRTQGPETQRNCVLWLGRHDLLGSDLQREDPHMRMVVGGLETYTPFGLAPGYDTDGRAAIALLKAGFGLVEVGTVTPQPQGEGRQMEPVEGGARSTGWTNPGAAVVAKNLSLLNKEDALCRQSVIGVSLAYGSSSETVSDIVEAFTLLAPHVSYVCLTYPESSPSKFCPTVDALARVADLIAGEEPTKIFVRVPGDASKEILDDCCGAAHAGKVAAVAVGCGVRDPDTVGWRLSGAPCKQASLDTVRSLSVALKGTDVSIIASNGILTSIDAMEFVEAGASFLQVYSAFAFGTPSSIRFLKSGCSRMMYNRHHYSLMEAVAFVDKPPPKKKPAKKPRSFMSASELA